MFILLFLKYCWRNDRKGHSIILFSISSKGKGFHCMLEKGDLIANVKRGNSGLASFPDLYASLQSWEKKLLWESFFVLFGFGEKDFNGCRGREQDMGKDFFEKFIFVDCSRIEICRKIISKKIFDIKHCSLVKFSQ